MKTAKIVVVVASDRTAESMLASNALSALDQDYELHFLTRTSVSFESSNLVTRIEPALMRNKLLRKLDLHFWYHALFCYLYRRNIDDRTSFKAIQLRPWVQRIHRFLSHPPVSRLISWIDGNLLFRVDSTIEHHLSMLSPSLLIAPGSALDSFSHIVVRTATRLDIPSVMLVTHWDYFSKKGLLRMDPTYIYVWGEEMMRLASDENGISKRKIRITGVPHFEKYLHIHSQDRDDARLSLNIERDQILILFAGTATPFDELSILQTLSEITMASRYKNVRFIYRPHPRAWSRESATTILPESLPNVFLDKVPEQGGTMTTHYLSLMSAVDAMISPFSTMILESALCGHPAFCIGFSDGINNWNFSEVNNSGHIKAILQRSWLKVCQNRNSLRSDFEAFLDMLKLGVDPKSIRNEVKSTVYFDKKPYCTRFKEMLETDFDLSIENRSPARYK